MNEVKDWILVVSYSDQDYPVSSYRVMATNDEMKKIVKSFVEQLLEFRDGDMQFDSEDFQDNYLWYFAVFPEMQVEVVAQTFNSLDVYTAKHFLDEEDK